MVQCNECRKRYHIDCLDPPLDTVPKKMKHYAWYTNCAFVKIV